MRPRPERETDEALMRRALDLARGREGLTRPNPPVGAVVVRSGRIVGEGAHPGAGKPHAEVFALRAAGRRARGSTVYVTLEPCCTQGRTPPCTDVILAAGVSRVVVAVRDPNPRHAGRGLRLLRKAGVKVLEGVGREPAAHLIEPFAKWIVTQRPWLTLKLAMTLDGRIADAQGRSKWITGSAARKVVHDARRRADAVMVGAGTVLADDPSLLPRPPRGRKTWRVIVDAAGRVPDTAQVFRDEAVERTLVATTNRCPDARMASWLAVGAQVAVLPGAGTGVDLPALMDHLGGLGLLHVLCEGGGALAGSLVRAGLVDEYLIFHAARILGGDGPVAAFGGPGWPLESAPSLRIREVRQIGPDLLVRARPLRRGQEE